MNSSAPNNMDALALALAPDMTEVNNIILSQLKSQSPLSEKVANHLITSGGKRLRPIVVLASAYLSGLEDMARAHKMAAAIEIMHTATLLHDDVVDESDKRRAMPTAHILWGNAPAVLVGDFLLGRAFELMVEVGSLEALRVLARAASVISEGEVMQLELKGAMDIKETEMMSVIAAKTASLFAAAAETSTILAESQPKAREAMRDFGFNLGMAFQLMDDALDYDGASDKFGKNVGSDFFEGKITMPLILCLRASNGAERNFLTQRIENPADSKPSDLRKVCALMKKYDALITTRDYALDYVIKAKSTLKMFDGDDWQRQFEHVADFCVARQF
jgi:octaprenyl-diphosphate synthase